MSKLAHPLLQATIFDQLKRFQSQKIGFNVSIQISHLSNETRFRTSFFLQIVVFFSAVRPSSDRNTASFGRLRANFQALNPSSLTGEPVDTYGGTLRACPYPGCWGPNGAVGGPAASVGASQRKRALTQQGCDRGGRQPNLGGARRRHARCILTRMHIPPSTVARDKNMKHHSRDEMQSRTRFPLRRKRIPLPACIRSRSAHWRRGA